MAELIYPLKLLIMSGTRKPALSPEVKQQIIWDFHNNHLSYYGLAKKYGISDHTAKRVVTTNPANYRAPAPVVWEPLQTREKLSEYHRLEQLTSDALSIVELTLQGMLRTLWTHPEKLNPTQLTAFMAAAAPYAVPRMQVRKSIPKEPVRFDRSHPMFRTRLED